MSVCMCLCFDAHTFNNYIQCHSHTYQCLQMNVICCFLHTCALLISNFLPRHHIDNCHWFHIQSVCAISYFSWMCFIYQCMHVVSFHSRLCAFTFTFTNWQAHTYMCVWVWVYVYCVCVVVWETAAAIFYHHPKLWRVFFAKKIWSFGPESFAIISPFLRPMAIARW